jgi:hypothetical protein
VILARRFNAGRERWSRVRVASATAETDRPDQSIVADATGLLCRRHPALKRRAKVSRRYAAGRRPIISFTTGKSC